MSSGRVCRLTPANTDEILRLVNFDDLNRATLVRELTAEDDYLWVGLVTPAGALCGVHRSMRWRRHLLLKGVFVDESARGSGAALELAFALRDSARSAGFAGIVAWVEPHKPEAGLARLLRLRQTSPLLHRFEIPLSDGDGQDSSLGDAHCFANSGTIVLDVAWRKQATPMLDDLLGVAEDPQPRAGAEPVDGRPPLGGCAAVHWVLDRHRLVLSGLPCRSIVDLPELTSAMKTLARAQGACALEIPVPAADISAALSLASIKARRLSRTPVRIGRLDFPAVSSHEKLATGAPAMGIDREFVGL